MKKRTAYNPKRRIITTDRLAALGLDELADRARYGGNPEHKLHPAEYGLSLVLSPRPGKTLCDAERPFLRREAERLLREGFLRGMVSEQFRGDWPQNVWAVDPSTGCCYESQLENQETGAYHGYPMPLGDDFREIVWKEWFARGR